MIVQGRYSPAILWDESPLPLASVQAWKRGVEEVQPQTTWAGGRPCVPCALSLICPFYKLQYLSNPSMVIVCHPPTCDITAPSSMPGTE